MLPGHTHWTVVIDTGTTSGPSPAVGGSRAKNERTLAIDCWRLELMCRPRGRSCRAPYRSTYGTDEARWRRAHPLLVSQVQWAMLFQRKSARVASGDVGGCRHVAHTADGTGQTTRPPAHRRTPGSGPATGAQRGARGGEGGIGVQCPYPPPPRHATSPPKSVGGGGGHDGALIEGRLGDSHLISPSVDRLGECLMTMSVRWNMHRGSRLPRGFGIRASAADFQIVCPPPQTLLLHPASQSPPPPQHRNWAGGKGQTKGGNRTGQTALAENGAERRRKRKGKKGQNHCGC